MKRILIEKMRINDDYDKYFGGDSNTIDSPDFQSNTSISNQKDHLINYIEEKCKQLMQSKKQTININEELNELNQSKLFLNNISDASFSLTKILETHRIFQSSRNSVVPKTEFLNTYSLRLNDSDYKNIITFSLINNKIYQAYVNNKKDIRRDVIKSKEMIANNVTVFPGHDADFDLVLKLLKERMPIAIRNSTLFLKQVPGFADLSDEYFTKLIKRGMVDYFIMIHCELFIDGESYMFFDNGIQLTRAWLSKIRGKEKSDVKYETVESLNRLNLTGREKALLCVYLYSIPDETLAPIEEELKVLNEFYKRALLYEFDLSRRDEKFLIEFEKVVDKLKYNRSLHNQN